MTLKLGPPKFCLRVTAFPVLYLSSIAHPCYVIILTALYLDNCLGHCAKHSTIPVFRLFLLANISYITHPLPT